LAADFQNRALMKLPHRTRARTLLLITAALLIVAWLVPPYFHAGRYRRLLEAGLESKLGRPVELGRVHFRLLPHPGFSIDQVTVKEDPRFGSEPFARMDGLECDLRWRSLWESRLDCARIQLDHPTLNIVRNTQGQWNLRSLFLRSNAVARIRSLGPATRSPEGFELDVEDARLNFTVGLTKTPFALIGVSGDLALDPSTGSVRFDFAGTPVRLDLPTPPPGAVELSGEWKPGDDFGGPLQATLHTNNSLLYGWIPLVTGLSPEIYGVVDGAIQISGRIARLGLAGDIHLDQLHRWDSLPRLSPMPVEISFKASLDRAREKLLVQWAKASFADSEFQLAGVINRISSTPILDLVLGMERSRLRDVLDMAGRLSGRQPVWYASGRADGLLTIRGPWPDRRYGGFIAIHSMRIQAHQLSFSLPQAGIRVDRRGAHLLPTRLLIAPGIQCIAEGILLRDRSNKIPRAPLSRRPGMTVQASGTAVNAHLHHLSVSPAHDYEFTISARQASVGKLLRLARLIGVQQARDIEAEGLANASVSVSGSVWPLGNPHVSARANLHHARLLVPGLTEPLRLARFHLESSGRNIQVNPLVTRIGPVIFSGWLKHDGKHDNPWTFKLSTSRVSLERASLWFAVLQPEKPSPFLDFIPWLRPFITRREAGRNIFSSIHALGEIESPVVTFRGVRLERVRAHIAIADRLARIGNVAFRVAGGAGEGSARIEFKRVPALITGTFKLKHGELARLAWRLPPTLRDVQGGISATGRFTTRGLTRREMAAGLVGNATIQLRHVSLGWFDPLQAFAHAASLGSFQPDHETARLQTAALNLHIDDQHAVLEPVQLKLAGAPFEIHGDYGFNGEASVYVRADLSRVRRSWRRISPTQLMARGSAQRLAWSSPSMDAQSPEAFLQDRPPAAPAGHPQSLLRPPRQTTYTAAVHLAGPIHALALIKDPPATTRP
jgi:hypothetical protein